MLLSIKSFCLLTPVSCLLLSAGPVDFGLAEFKAALDARHLRTKIVHDLSPEAPESFRIEPYKAGGAHITGGDMRGLMYGLLEAADQIRTTGRLKQVHAVPATLVRGTRLFARDADFDEHRWHSYFEMLARDRFNRFTLIYAEPPRDFARLRSITQAAADFGIDFTLALWEHEPDAALGKILAECPLIRAVQIRNTTHDLDTYRALVFKPLRAAGRRVALDPEPDFIKPAQESGIALRTDPPSWPPGFDIDAPRDFEQHAIFYFIFGRAAYDPKIEPAHSPAHSEDPAEFAAATQAAWLITSSDAQSNDWVASIAEAVHNAVENVASAKRTPLDAIAEMKTDAAKLDRSSFPDLQLIGKMARDRVEKLQISYDAELAGRTAARAKPEPRPKFQHTPVKSAPIDKPTDLTLQISPAKSAVSIRLHYRPLNSTETATIEKPAAESVSFTIPPSDTDLIYFFEILNAESTGWFEPDPFTTTPYYVIKIEPKPPTQ